MSPVVLSRQSCNASPQSTGRTASFPGDGKSGMNRLPTDCLQHILSFCGLRQVFSCMRVSREWLTAAHFAVQQRSWHVCLIRQRHCVRECCQYGYNEIVVSPDTDIRSLTQSLRRVRRLASLFASSFAGPDIEDIVSNCASSLTRLAIHSLPQQQGILYPKLVHLECESLSVEAASRCPRLRELHLSSQPDYRTLAHLPLALLTTLQCKLELPPDSSLRKAVHALSRLANLEILDLEIKMTEDASSGLTTSDFRSLTLLFRCFSRLREFSLWCQADVEELYDDDAVGCLVSQNSRLTHVSFTILCLTDEILRSLALLSLLRTLDLRSDNTALTTEAVLLFLRGNSRSNLKSVTICHQQHLGHEKIRSEVALLAQEAGRKVSQFRYDVDRFDDDDGSRVQVCSLFFSIA